MQANITAKLEQPSVPFCVTCYKQQLAAARAFESIRKTFFSLNMSDADLEEVCMFIFASHHRARWFSNSTR